MGGGGGGEGGGGRGGNWCETTSLKKLRSNLCDILTVKLQEVRARICIKNSSPSMASSGS